MIVKGVYRKGQGRAHLAMSEHEGTFGHPMFGTFNIKTMKSIEQFTPSLKSTDGKIRYWTILIDGTYPVWAVRRDGTAIPPTLWEIISREKLPVALRQGRMDIEVLEGVPA